jgi:DNA invertase Pin-like site-specific DNA recombinase
LTNLGYARVPTTGQDLDGQLVKLKSAGCVKVYREKLSGARCWRRSSPSCGPATRWW